MCLEITEESEIKHFLQNVLFLYRNFKPFLLITSWPLLLFILSIFIFLNSGLSVEASGFTIVFILIFEVKLLIFARWEYIFKAATLEHKMKIRHGYIYNGYHNNNVKTMPTNKYYHNSFETNGKMDKIRYDKYKNKI